jgi:hypothetical protein
VVLGGVVYLRSYGQRAPERIGVSSEASSQG